MKFEYLPPVRDADAAEGLGVAFASRLRNEGTVAVGHDGASEELAQALAKGLNRGGVSTLAVGPCDSPELYFLVGRRELAGSCMLTRGSAKLCLLESGAVRPVSLVEGEMLDAAQPSSSPPGITALDAHALTDYVAHVASVVGDSIGNFKLAVDTTTCSTVDPPLQALLANHWTGVTQHPHEFRLAGHWPGTNKVAREPSVAARKENWDLGVAFDDDGDSVVFVDDQGAIVPPHLMTALLAGPVLKAFPRATICHALCRGETDGRPWRWAPYVIDQEVKSLSGSAIGAEPGNVATVMRDARALLAGACPGHYHWADHWYASSALITLGKVLALLTSERPLSVLLRVLVKRLRSSSLQDLSDWELTELSRFGHDAAFEALYVRHRAACVHGGVVADHCDVAFADLWRSRFQVDPRKAQSLLPKLWDTARNCAKGENKNKTPVVVDPETRAAPPAAPSPEELHEALVAGRDELAGRREFIRDSLSKAANPEEAVDAETRILVYVLAAYPPAAAAELCFPGSNFLEDTLDLDGPAAAAPPPAPLVRPELWAHVCTGLRASGTSASVAARDELEDRLEEIGEEEEEEEDDSVPLTYGAIGDLLWGPQPSRPNANKSRVVRILKAVDMVRGALGPPASAAEPHEYSPPTGRPKTGSKALPCHECKRVGGIEIHLPHVAGASPVWCVTGALLRTEPTLCRLDGCNHTHSSYWYRYTWDRTWRRQLLGAARPTACAVVVQDH